jgi:serine/threonine protein kinase/tetratricopeptide (TPR) repeat protein
MVDAKPDVLTIFGEALAQATDLDRANYLDRACRDDIDLRQRIDKLLRAHEEAGNFLGGVSSAGGTIEHSPITERPGTVIGPYKLLQQIGEGGFGVVFEAEQDRPVKRRVALKIIKPGMDTREVIARFEAERQALAMMDHPNIAKVLDAGTTGGLRGEGLGLRAETSSSPTLNSQLSTLNHPSARPYFVMELVQGVPITEYCDQCNLTTRERLELFVTVCQAVQHAHQKGIIHRDIKPTNVLVAIQDGQPSPKIIDFGVAKALNQQLTEHTLVTAFAQIVGTPLYMSPEQAELSPLGVDTRSDIYSLGVLLYELLTGTTPFDKDRLHSASYDELRRIIREEEPPRPSARLSTLAADLATTVAAHRRTDAGRLHQQVRGELDWIVMKCLEKDRNRRYETPSSLARDVERYLHDEPVQACPPSAAYRLKKFIRRNKVGVLAGSAIAAALIAGLTMASMGFVQARRQAEIARVEAVRSTQVAQFLKDMLKSAGPQVARGRDATLLREILEQTAQRVDKDLHDQPEIQGDLWMTLGNTYSDIGDVPRAASNYQHAVDSYRLAFGRDHARLALALARLGRCQSFSGDVARGKNNALLGLEMARSCGDPETLASCLSNVAGSFSFWGMTSQQAVPYLREAVALRKQLGTDPVALANCMHSLACNIRDFPLATDREECESLHRAALALHRKHLGTDDPRIAWDLYGQGITFVLYGKLEEAETVLREAVDRFRRVYDDAHPHQGIVRGYLATSLVLQNKWQEAESVARGAAESSPSGPVDGVLLGRINAYRGEWATAAEQFLRTGYSEYEAAVALLEAGREEEYRQVCHRFLDRKPGKREYSDSQRAIAFLLLPADNAHHEAIEQIANRSDATDRVLASRARVDKALAAYRLGHFEAANEYASPAVIEGARLPNQAQAWFIQALANARLQRIDKARSTFAEGNKMINQFDPVVQDDLLWDWTDWTIAKRLQREAATLIGPKAADEAVENSESVNNDDQQRTTDD